MAKTKQTRTITARESNTFLPAPLPVIAEAITGIKITDPRTLDFLALPLVVHAADGHPVESAMWPRVIAARLRQVQGFGIDEAMVDATPAEMCAYMESLTRMTPPDDQGISVGVFALSMYRMLVEMGYPADLLPETIAKGACLSIEAARAYQQTARAIRLLQIARQGETPPTDIWAVPENGYSLPQ